jgi:hypothetical protein
MDRYKELLAMRDRFLGEARMAKAEVELNTLVATDDLAMRAFTLQVQDVAVTWCGVLWVPCEPL